MIVGSFETESFGTTNLEDASDSVLFLALSDPDLLAEEGGREVAGLVFDATGVFAVDLPRLNTGTLTGVPADDDDAVAERF